MSEHASNNYRGNLSPYLERSAAPSPPGEHQPDSPADDLIARYNATVRPSTVRPVIADWTPGYLGYALPTGRRGENPSVLPERLPLPSATNVAPEAASPPTTETEAVMPAPDDDLLWTIKTLAEAVEQLGKRQDTLAERFTEQNQVFDRYLKALPPQLPVGAPPPMLPGASPGTSIQVVPPHQIPSASQTIFPSEILPPSLGQPMVRRDIKKVVMNGPSGRPITLAAVEVITTTDPLTGSETSETINHRYKNSRGEPVDHNRPLHACVNCAELTNTPYRCLVCHRPLCSAHVYVQDQKPTNDEHKDYRCWEHYKRPEFSWW